MAGLRVPEGSRPASPCWASISGRPGWWAVGGARAWTWRGGGLTPLVSARRHQWGSEWESRCWGCLPSWPSPRAAMLLTAPVRLCAAGSWWTPSSLSAGTAASTSVSSSAGRGRRGVRSWCSIDAGVLLTSCQTPLQVLQRTWPGGRARGGPSEVNEPGALAVRLGERSHALAVHIY